MRDSPTRTTRIHSDTHARLMDLNRWSLSRVRGSIRRIIARAPNLMRGSTSATKKSPSTFPSREANELMARTPRTTG